MQHGTHAYLHYNLKQTCICTVRAARKQYTTNLDAVDEMLVLWADEGVPCVGRIHVQPKVFTCTHLAKLVYVVKGAARGCTQGSAHLRDTKLKSRLRF